MRKDRIASVWVLLVLALGFVETCEAQSQLNALQVLVRDVNQTTGQVTRFEGLPEISESLPHVSALANANKLIASAEKADPLGGVLALAEAGDLLEFNGLPPIPWPYDPGVEHMVEFTWRVRGVIEGNGSANFGMRFVPGRGASPSSHHYQQLAEFGSAGVVDEVITTTFPVDQSGITYVGSRLIARIDEGATGRVDFYEGATLQNVRVLVNGLPHPFQAVGRFGLQKFSSIPEPNSFSLLMWGILVTAYARRPLVSATTSYVRCIPH